MKSLRTFLLPLGVSVFVVGGLLWWLFSATDQVDPDFNAHVSHPAYPVLHPRVYFDAERWDSALYRPFVQLIRNDGYAVSSKKGAITINGLRGYEVLVLANALGFRDGAKQIPGIRHNLMGEAFTPEECTAIRGWVMNGGSLLLASDYSPTSKNAVALAREFGIIMRDGWVIDPANHDPDTGNPGFLIFTRDSGQLVNHPITRGSNNAERLTRIITYMGMGLEYPSNATPLLKLSATAMDFPYHEGATKHQFNSAATAAQGIALEYEQGRVVILGDSAVLTSLRSRKGNRTFHFGMGDPNYGDRQLALNIMHWLSRWLN